MLLNWLWFLYVSRFDNRRGLYLFHDGRRWRQVDAMVAVRTLMTSTKFDWDKTPALLNEPNAVIQSGAAILIAEVVREVFSVPQSKQGGLSDLGCVDLLNSFSEYLDNVKKNTSLWPISQPSTEVPDIVKVYGIPTKPGWDSGSIANAPQPASPGSPAEPTTGNTTP